MINGADIMTQTLAQYLRERNAKTEAWVAEDPDNRWAGMYTEDLSHWAEMGIYTVAQLERYDMETTIWDLYKDVTGIRPRHMDFKSMSDEDLRKEYDYLVGQLKWQEENYPEEFEDEDTSSWEREFEEEQAAVLAEQPEPIDYIACRHQDGWL